MGIDSKGNGIGSCFPKSKSLDEQENKEMMRLQEKAEKIIKNIFRENHETNSSEIPFIGSVYDNDDVQVIDELNNKLDNRCAKISIIICRADWNNKGGFKKSLENNAINNWLRCWDENKLTYFITPSWEANSFKTLKKYIESYCENNNHNVLVLMWDKTNGLRPIYPTK